MPAGSYPVYWTMSVMDYLWASGNVAEFNKLLPDVEANLGDQVRKRLSFKCAFSLLAQGERLRLSAKTGSG